MNFPRILPENFNNYRSVVVWPQQDKHLAEGLKLSRRLNWVKLLHLFELLWAETSIALCLASYYLDVILNTYLRSSFKGVVFASICYFIKPINFVLCFWNF